jgi:probable rRNA maturation factor
MKPQSHKGRPSAKSPREKSFRPPRIEFLIKGRAGDETEASVAVIRSALRQACRLLGLHQANEISVVACDNSVMRRLNRRWRSIDKPTNVLSFPAQNLTPGRKPRPEPLGDIVISLPYAGREARELKKKFEEHLAHLAVHALLHLVGYDHEREIDANRMERREKWLLNRIKI